jgi:A/G-specific adenine glycosylase
MEFGALVCKPKEPICSICNLNKNCKYFKSSKKIKTTKYKMIENKNYDVFCYVNKKKQIALTKKNNLGFLNQFSLPEIREAKDNVRTRDWKFLKKYKNSISNKKLNINLYYKFSNKIPPSFIWHSMDKNKDFIPTFTKNIFRQVSILF